MRRLAALSFSLAIATLCCLPVLATAATSTSTTQRGLLITPTQDDAKVTAGVVTRKTLVVANLTQQPITVALSIKEFSVANYTYDYSFTNPHSKWISLGVTELALAPQQSKTVPYTIAPNSGAAPGGYYYTLFASSKLSSGGLSSTVQAASLLFVTVNGHLVQTGQLEKASVDRFVFGDRINYRMDAINTGNVYYAASIAGQLRGPWVKPATSAVSHILIPGKVRRLTGSIPSPLLPGIYKADFGYVTDSGTRVELSRWIIYIPYWSLAIVVGVILMVRGWRGKRKPPGTGGSDDIRSVIDKP